MFSLLTRSGLGGLAFLISVGASIADAREAQAATDHDAAYHYALATMLAGEGELESAVAEFDAAIRADPAAAFPRIEYAEVLLRLDRVPAALAQSEESLRLAPRDAEVLRGYGQVQLSVARRAPQAIDRAMRALETLREVDPTDVAGMVTLGQIYQSLGRHDDAIEIFQELVNHHNDHRQLRRLLVDALTAAGQTERARSVLEELIQIDQESLDNRLALAQLESEKGNHGAAIELLESGLREGEEADPQLLLALSQELVQRSQSPGLSEKQRDADLARALQILDELLARSYDFAVVARRARVLALRGDLDGAEEALREARTRLPGDPRPSLQLARVLEGKGKDDEAAAILSSLLEARADASQAVRLEVRQRLAGLEARRGNWRQVLEHTDALLDQLDSGDSRAEIIAFQAEAWTQLGRPQKALELLEREEQRYGPDPRLLLGRADLLGELDRDDEAFAVLARPELASATEEELFFGRLRSLLALDAVEAAVESLRRRAETEGGDGLLRGGQFLSFHGQYQAAIPFLKDALAVEPDSSESLSSDQRADAHFFLGQAYERTSRFDDAAAQFEQVLRLREEDSTAMNYLGYMWADQGVHLERALELIERAVALQPDNGAYVDSLGWALYRLGRFDDARESLERAASLTPDNATVHEHLGDVYVALGDVDQARRSYERALQLDDHEDVEKVREKLARLRSGSL